MADQDNINIAEQLTEIPFFKSFTTDEIDSVLLYIELKSFNENTTLFEEGDRGDYFCFVIEGIIELRKESISTRQTVSVKFGRGSAVGEMAIVDQFPRSATARVTANSKLLILTQTNFEELVEKYPRTGIKCLREIARTLSLRLRQSSGRFADVF